MELIFLHLSWKYHALGKKWEETKGKGERTKFTKKNSASQETAPIPFLLGHAHHVACRTMEETTLKIWWMLIGLGCLHYYSSFHGKYRLRLRVSFCWLVLGATSFQWKNDLRLKETNIFVRKARCWGPQRWRTNTFKFKVWLMNRCRASRLYFLSSISSLTRSSFSVSASLQIFCMDELLVSDKKKSLAERTIKRLKPSWEF